MRTSVRAISASVEARSTLTKFVVKVSRASAGPSAYVLRVNDGQIQMTSNRKLALVMSKFAAQDAIQSLAKSGSAPELVPVRFTA